MTPLGHQRRSGRPPGTILVILSIFSALWLFPGSAAAQQWSSRAEYDMALEVRNQPVPEARLGLIEQWKRKFPSSPLAKTRAELALDAAEALGDPAKISSAARELLTVDANSFAAHYWITLLAPSQPDQSASALDASAASAARLVSTAGSFFGSPAVKELPPGAAGAHRQHTLALAHRTIGWVEWRRGNLDAAQRALLASLMADPQRADVSAWLGTILAPSPEQPLRLAAIWHLARAAFLDGPGVLPSAERREVRALLEAAYAAYHGSTDGLDKIGESARSTVLPPNDFRIETAAEAAERAWEDGVLKANPDLQPYLDIRRRLLAARDEDLAQLIPNIVLPSLRGTLLGCNPEARPRELQIGITGPGAQEAVLKLDSALSKCPDLGAVLEFQGTLSDFTRQPFLLTIEIARKAITITPPPALQ